MLETLTTVAGATAVILAGIGALLALIGAVFGISFGWGWNLVNKPKPSEVACTPLNCGCASDPDYTE